MARKARKAVGPAPDLSPVVSDCRPIGLCELGKRQCTCVCVLGQSELGLTAMTGLGQENTLQYFVSFVMC